MHFSWGWKLRRFYSIVHRFLNGGFKEFPELWLASVLVYFRCFETGQFNFKEDVGSAAFKIALMRQPHLQ